MAITAETELYEPVKAFFETLGYEVKGEVVDCDLVALRENEEPILAELKRSFNLSLLFQGADRLRLSPRVYLCVEKTARGPGGRRWSEAARLCRCLGVGLITVDFGRRRQPYVEVHCDPGEQAVRRNKKQAAGLVKEFRERSGDYNIGGSTKRKRMTAYREKALQVACRLQALGASSPKQLRIETGVGSAPAILQRNVYGWFERIGKGRYRLTDSGNQALRDYAHILPQILASKT